MLVPVFISQKQQAEQSLTKNQGSCMVIQMLQENNYSEKVEKRTDFTTKGI